MIFGKKYPLGRVTFEATEFCDAGCLYCYNHYKRPGTPSAKPDSYKQSLKTLKHLFRTAQIEHVVFSGGEPTMAERFFELVLFTRLRGATVSVLSNGGARPEVYRELAKLGVSTIQIPYHSTDPGIHDQLMAKPGLQKMAKANLQIIRESGMNPVAVIVLTRLNASTLADTIRALVDSGIPRIMLNRFNPGGRGLRNLDLLIQNQEELQESFRTANAIAKNTGAILTANVCTPFCLLSPGEFPHIGFATCRIHSLESPMTMDATGDIRLCNHSPEVAGNIFKNSYEKIFQSPYMEKWKTEIPGFCTSCADYSSCRGGCRAASEQIGIGLHEVDPILELSSRR